MSELIKDGEIIRRCQLNMEKLGYWGSFKNFHGYKRTAGMVDWKELFAAVILLLQTPIYLILLPALPFIQCWFEWRRAKTEVALEKKNTKLN